MHDHDHRAIANRMELFHQQEEGPGMVFWHPRGYAIYRIVEDDIRRRMRSAGFREIRTPQLLARSLWEKSGHWEKFGDSMFALGEDGHAQALKPMSCPCHVQVFNKRLRSFRDLPIRLSEFGACHRDEPSGSLQGLMRMRAFVQDDAHIFCTEDQVVDEVAKFCRLLQAAYADYGFRDLRIAFSTRPSVRAGANDVWDRAEAASGSGGKVSRARLSPRSGRRRVLWAKAGFPPARQPRPRMAMRDDPARHGAARDGWTPATPMPRIAASAR